MRCFIYFIGYMNRRLAPLKTQVYWLIMTPKKRAYVHFCYLYIYNLSSGFFRWFLRGSSKLSGCWIYQTHSVQPEAPTALSPMVNLQKKKEVIIHFLGLPGQFSLGSWPWPRGSLGWPRCPTVVSHPGLLQDGGPH